MLSYTRKTTRIKRGPCYYRMQLAPRATRPTPHDASRLVHAMSAWSVKTRHAPPRRCRDARAYVRTTAATHETKYIFPIEHTRTLFLLQHQWAEVSCCPLTIDGVLPVGDGDRWVDDLQLLLEQKGEANVVGHDAWVKTRKGRVSRIRGSVIRRG